MSFDLQPHLQGDLLALRPLRPGDFDDLYQVASDPLIWEQHPARDRYKPEVFKAFFREALDSRGTLIAIDSTDGQVIGSSRFHGYDEKKSEIEIGWTFLARSRWGGAHNRDYETSYAAARLQIREQRYLPCWPTESAVTEGRGKDRRSAGGIKTRR
jgi:Acetyltransferase (GNAT) domain